MSKELKFTEIKTIFYYSNDNGEEIKYLNILVGPIKVAK